MTACVILDQQVYICSQASIHKNIIHFSFVLYQSCFTFCVSGLYRVDKYIERQYLLWHAARNGEIGEFDLDFFQPVLAVVSVNIINTGNIEREVSGVPWRLDCPIPGTIADNSYITGCERQDTHKSYVIKIYCFSYS